MDDLINSLATLRLHTQKVSSSCKMDSKKEDDDLEILKKSKKTISKLYKKIEKIKSESKASGSSPSSSPELKTLHQQLSQLMIAFKEANQHIKTPLRIHHELEKVFDAEEVGHSCDLCQRDLATDPERPNASLRSLQEACVLACGHVYHFKCLRGTTLDLDNSSSNPSCIFCIS